MIKSIYNNQQDILEAIQTLHCPMGYQCDLTYGNGSFWKNIAEPKLVFDVTPLYDHVQQADSSNVPVESGTLDNVVFDPPFITYVKNGREHGGENKMVMSKRFGGYWDYPELTAHYTGTIKEAHRILKKKGMFVFKCQDIIHNHKLHPTHINVVNWAAEEKFRLADMFILAANHRIPRAGVYQQKHARIYHSYFLVLQKIK